MSDVTVNLGMAGDRDEKILSSAIEMYTQWRQNMCDMEARAHQGDAPDIMVKTAFAACGAVSKTLIFQERRWAAAFLLIWRHQRRHA
ncbi:MAG: hypothetical protein AAGH87_08265 [Pseudomonadota bacterium]